MIFTKSTIVLDFDLVIETLELVGLGGASVYMLYKGATLNLVFAIITINYYNNFIIFFITLY